MLQNDQEHLKRKYQIGAILGVKRKEGHLSVVKEISRDMCWPLLIVVVISGMFCGVFIKSYYYGTMEIVLIQKEVAMLGWILCIYGIIFMIFIIFSTRRIWKEISKICDRIIFLKDGKVKEDLKRTGDKEQFYNEIITNWC